MAATSYGLSRIVESSYDDTVAAVREALKAEGFSIVSELDLQEMLQGKLGVDIGKCLILGTCNPPLTHRALVAEADVALLLPCNVVITQTTEGVKVNALNVEALVSGFDNLVLADVGHEIKNRLQRIVDAV